MTHPTLWTFGTALRAAFAPLLILVLVTACAMPSPTTAPAATSVPTPTLSPTLSREPRDERLTTETPLPIAIDAWDSDTIEFFNRYARDSDYAGAGFSRIDLLDAVEIGEKLLVFGELRVEDPREMVSLAQERGIGIMVYCLEMALPKEELVDREKAVYELAKGNGLLFAFSPTVVDLEKYYADFAQYTDVVILQSQRYQLQEDYEEVVEGLIGRIKSVNPDVKVWVRISVRPPDPKTRQRVDLSADQVIDHIRLIEDKADAASILYLPRDPSVMKEVFRRLREQ